MTTRAARTEKLDLRISPAAKQKLRAAAEVANRSVSDFVLHSALTHADEVLADRRHFSLSAAQWKRFLKALDAPPRSHTRMKRLLNEPSVFERR